MDIKLYENQNQNSKVSENSSPYNSINVSKSQATAASAIFQSGATFSKDTIGQSKFGNAAYKDGASLLDIQNEAASKNVKSEKDYMVVMANTVSDKDMKQMFEDGFEPGDMKPEEVVTIVDEIKTTMAKAGVVIEGYNSDLDVEKVKEITGSDVYAYDIAASFAKYDVPCTKENVNSSAQALSLVASINQEGLSEGAINYLVENSIEPTIENLYMSEHSSANSDNSQGRGYFSDGNGYLGKKAENIDDKLLSQIKEIVEESGFEYNDETANDAVNMIKNGLMLTSDSFSLYEEIKSIKIPMEIEDATDKISRNIKDGFKAKDTNLAKEDSVMDEAVKLVQKVNEIKDGAVDKVLEKGMKLNIKNLAIQSRSIVAMSSNEATGYMEASALLQETRLHMSVSSTYVLLKNNINVDITDLSLLVDELKEAENRQFESVFGSDKSKEIAEQFIDTKDKIDKIKGLPVEVLGKITARSSYTLNVVYAEGTLLKTQFENANEKYEPLMTEVRRDLGDSINKAFNNVSDILKEMNMEVSEANERAVKILGYNSMEITDENIEKVKDTYNQVKNVINLMTPAKVLELIKEGVNPLELSMEELEKKLSGGSSSSFENSYKEAEKFSHFLVRMEENGTVNEDEKESFIGIYRLINNIEKNEGAAIGTLINQRGEINFKNLLSAVRTRKDKGMDFKVDDEFGFLEKLNTKGETIDQQIERAFEVNKTETDRYEKGLMEQANETKQYVSQLLESLDIPGTINNINALNEVLSNSNNIFKKMTELSDKSTKKQQNVDKNVNKSSEKVNFTEVSDEIEKMISDVNDSLESPENAKDAFENAALKVADILSELENSADNSIDVRGIAAAFKQVNVVRSLANNEFYQVPVKVGDEYTSVSVRIIHGSNEDKGNVAFHMSHEEYGEINASFKYLSSGLEGFILCDNEEGLGRLSEKAEKFSDSLDFIEGNKNINYIKSKTGLNQFVESSDKLYRNASKGIEANESMDAISTKALYKVAKEFIRTFV